MKNEILVENDLYFTLICSPYPYVKFGYNFNLKHTEFVSFFKNIELHCYLNYGY